jgi:subtilisin family serine protease
MLRAAVAATLLASAAVAAPIQNLVPLSQEGDILPGQYIVQFKRGVELDVAKALAESVKAKYFYNIPNSDPSKSFVGFSGSFDDNVLESLRFRTDLLENIENNQVARTNARQTNPPSWGLGAASSADATNPGYYDYPDNAGAGVKIYVIDTGVRTTHVDFEGRAVWGERFGNGGYEDGNGHGTHCAGTAGGASYGIAKKASIVAVGVLGPAGSGSYDDVIAGVNWSADDCGNSKCVGSMSLGGGASTAVDNAVNAFVENNRFMAVAAGNSNTDARNSSPARAADVYTVMATDSNARKASYSNYGSVCSVWAPGSSITSAWSTSNTATNTISGTSMACPHVAGQGALAFAGGRLGTDKFAVENYLNDLAVTGQIVGVPTGTTDRFMQVDVNM